MTSCTFPACLCQEAHELEARLNKAAAHMGLKQRAAPRHVISLCPHYEHSYPSPSQPAEFHLKERWRKYGWHE